ncbi:MAG TPA: hypothetical protein VMY34_04415 [Acidimicrobiales bacterium]|nr:hypothetical protein [Acidimicrobiales bacterium]
MSLRAIRRLVAVTCIAAIGGMIAGSIADNDAAAMTAGSVAAIAVLCLLVGTSVERSAGRSHPASDETETVAAEVEKEIAALVADGVEEARVRRLVAGAVRVGRTTAPNTPSRGRD